MTRKKTVSKDSVVNRRTSPQENVSVEVNALLVRFRMLASLRRAWLEKLWSEEGAPSGRTVISPGEIESNLEDRDSPEAENAWLQTDDWASQTFASLGEIENVITDPSGRLEQINRVFGIGKQESDLLQACLAVALDPSLARVCGYLQDHTGRSYVTEDLAARLFHYGRASVWGPESALFRWELISSRDMGPGEPRALACDPYIRDWFLKRSSFDGVLVDIARVYEAKSPLRSWPVEESVGFIKQTIDGDTPERMRFVISGARGSGRRTLAATVSAAVGLPLLVINADRVDEAAWPGVFLHAQRQGYLERRAIAWVGETMIKRLWPSVPMFPLQFVICDTNDEPIPNPEIVERRIRMPVLGISERQNLWSKYIPAAKQWSKVELDTLSQAYRVHVGDIVDAARARVSSVPETINRVREAGRSRLGRLAQLLETPFVWDDLVVAEPLKETLKDIVFEARHRGDFWEQENSRRMFPQGRGLIALFSGPPGTGKTMSAQVIAANLQQDLFRIDLSSIVSKYVGETSQNLERLLTRAAEMDAVLLFDEADAMFSKRVSEVRDAQDKFANTDAAYLLQAIESFPGIAILATNQKQNIDPAFIRRLRFVIEFEKPNASQRLEIWTKVIAGLAGNERLEALRDDLRAMSDSLEVTGAQIKFGILGAVFISKRMDQELNAGHLLKGMERELAKEGRALGARDRKRMFKELI